MQAFSINFYLEQYNICTLKIKAHYYNMRAYYCVYMYSISQCLVQVVGAVLDRLLEVATIPEKFNKPE